MWYPAPHYLQTMRHTLSKTLVLYRDSPLPAGDCMEAVERVAREFAERACVLRTDALVASALQREAEDPTCVGRALAVPHARVAGLSCAGIYIARMEHAVAWPVEAVRMVAFIAVPEEAPEMYLQMMAQLVRWWMQECAEYGDSVHIQPMQVLTAPLAERMRPSC